jgi:hypothetical protein
MTNLKDDEEEREAGAQKKKGEGDKAGSGQGRQAARVSEAAQSLMQERGLSLHQITEILRNWRHLDAKEVALRLADFGSDMAKASAHIVVSFSHDAGYALVMNFAKQVQRLTALARKLSVKKAPKITESKNLG